VHYNVDEQKKTARGSTFVIAPQVIVLMASARKNRQAVVGYCVMNRHGSSFEMVSLTLTIITCLDKYRLLLRWVADPEDKKGGLPVSQRLAAHRSGRAIS